ncbi:MAG: beta/gamma crystallin family protein [Alphaproteobacteria bacterium]|nr:beta/gamma crystallin family protein [Alphaproteobacteria bacterium]MBU0863447.1 beta/gamma crystallin family protein [Alphaproteobacteria bacterium]MBU1826485.1 beta/gamma crystallin family protein [Alphaproteobacteria bacterium]
MFRLACMAAAAAAVMTPTMSAAAQEKAKTIEGVLTLFEGQQFDRQSYRVTKDNPSVPHDFLVGSIAVYPGEVWEVCDKTKFRGNCLTISSDESQIGKALIKSVRAIKVAQ